MLNLVVGNDKSLMSDYFYSQIKESLCRRFHSVLIVPEIRSHFEERRLLENCGNAAGFFVEITTFSKLCEKLITLENGSFECLDPAGRIITMRRALMNVRSSLKYYKRIKLSSAGSLEKLLDICDELEDSGVKPSDFLNAGKRDRVLDLAKIYSAYEELCRNTLPDKKQLLERASGLSCGYLNGRSVFIAGFDGFSKRELDFIKKLCGFSEVTVMLSCGTDVGIYERQIKTAEELKRGEYGTCVKSFYLKMPGEYYETARSLFDYSAEKCEAPSGLGVFYCRDMREECELAAAKCRILALNGKRFRDITVVCPEPGNYVELIKAAFEKYEVPVLYGERTPALDVAPAEAFMAAVKTAASSYDSETFISWLKTRFSGITRDDCEELENYAFTWRINGSGWGKEWVEPPEGYREGKSDSAELERLNTARKKAYLSVNGLKSGFLKAETVRDYCTVCLDFLEERGFEEITYDMADELTGLGLGLEAGRLSQAVGFIASALEQMSSICGSEKINSEDFAALCELALSQYSVSSIPPSVDCVTVVDFQKAIYDGLDCVIILGALDGSFPKGAGDPGLLSESDRVELEGEGIVLTKNKNDILERNVYALFSVISGAKSSLTVTYPLFSASGSENNPSYLLKRLEEVYEGFKAAAGEPALGVMRFSAPQPAFTEACRLGTDVCRAYFDRFPEEKALFEKIKYQTDHPYDVIKNRETLARLYGSSVRLSATGISSYSSCRFLYFLENGLKLRERKEAAFDALEVGTFIHSIAENAIRDYFEGKGEIAEITEKYAVEFLESIPGYSEKNSRFISTVGRIKEKSLIVTQSVVDEILDSGFRPFKYELSFGIRDGVPALKINNGEVNVELVGAIDRVDTMERGGRICVKVSDYKTGTKEFKISDILYGENLQLYIYLLALEQNSEKIFGTRDIKASAAVYIPSKMEYLSLDYGYSQIDFEKKNNAFFKRMGIAVDDPDIRSALRWSASERFYKDKSEGGFYYISEDKVRMLLDECRRIVLKTAGEIMSGKIEPNPHPSGSNTVSCTYCRFKDACFFEKTSLIGKRETVKEDEVFERIGGCGND